MALVGPLRVQRDRFPESDVAEPAAKPSHSSRRSAIAELKQPWVDAGRVMKCLWTGPGVGGAIRRLARINSIEDEEVAEPAVKPGSV